MSEIIGKREVSFTDYLSILLKWKKFLIINLLIIGIGATIYSYTIPEKFKSTATVMIQESGGGGLLDGMMSNLGGVLGGALGGGGSIEDKLFGFLASYQMSENIINKFNLVDYYEIEKYKREKTLKAFKEDFQYDLNDNGFIEISMIHEEPEKSAEIVNYAVNELIRLNQTYATTYAKKYREFVEKRYFKNMKEVKIAEQDFEQFQEKHKIYAIPEQLEVSFAAYAELEKELSLKDLERDMVEETQGKDNPTFKRLNAQVKLMREKISQLKNGEGDFENSLIFIDLKEIPKIQREYLQIKRELEIQAKLLEFTLPMYEQAVMEEQKTIPAITVIDKAMSPELKHSPKKAFIILSFLFISFLILLVITTRGEIIINKEKDGKEQNLFQSKEYSFYLKIIRFYKINL